MFGSMGEEDAVISRLAVLGETFDVALAAELAGLPPAELLVQLDAAQQAGVLTVDGGTVSFRPGLREKRYAGLGAHGQAAAHAAAAEVLARVRPGDLDGIAIQRAGAVAILGPEPVLAALEVSIAAAVRAYDWPRAAGLLAQAATIAQTHHDPRAQGLALQQARVLYRAGLFGDAMAAVRVVARSARAAGDARLLAEAALAIRGIGDRELCAELLDLCREAVRDLPKEGDDEDLARRARLLGQLAILTAELAHAPADASLAAQSLRLAEASKDPRAIVEALHAIQMSRSGPRDVEHRLAIADRAESLAVEADLDDLLGMPLGWRVDALFQLGRRPALDEAIARLEEHGRNRNDGLANWKARMAWAVIAQVEGRFPDAERQADEAVEIARRGGHAGAEFIHKILFSYCRGLTVLGQPDDRPIEDFPMGGDVMLAFPAMEAANHGNMEAAAVLFDRAYGVIGDVAGRELEVQTYCALSIAAWALDRVDAAEVLRTALSPFAHEMGVSCNGQAACLGSVARFMGQMAALCGEWESVEADFALAQRRNMEFGNRPGVAETRVDWARALLRRGSARERERAAGLLEAAEREAQKLEMTPLAQVAAGLSRGLKAGPAHPLSAREVEVARLVADGLSNKEVAARLHLSVRTAENHLLNVMNKLGLDNRAQVAAWATRTLTSPDA